MLKKLKSILKIFGPGFITGASDDDPSGIATYSQTGAAFGYNQLWTALFSYPFMTVVQEMCGRIGLVTGKGLAGVIRHHYPKKFLWFSVLLLFLANTINIGADLGAMAASAQMIFGVPFIFWLLGITALTLGLEIFLSYNIYAKVLKWLTFSLFAYILVVFFVKQDWVNIARSTLLPSIQWSQIYLLNIVAILGTTISPYLYFWQADEEVEEEVAEHKIRSFGAGISRIRRKDITDMRIDTAVGMGFSNLVMFFIIATTASTLHVHGIFDINTPQQAAEALKPFAGNLAYLLFATGIIGTGLLAVPVLAGSVSYAISESFGWRAGLYQKLKKAHGFYGAIIVATLIGLLINFIGISPIKALYYASILNGLLAPPLLVMIMLISNNRDIMGGRTNGKLSNYLGWIITAVMSVCALVLIIQFLFFS